MRIWRDVAVQLRLLIKRNGANLRCSCLKTAHWAAQAADGVSNGHVCLSDCSGLESAEPGPSRWATPVSDRRFAVSHPQRIRIDS